MAYFPQMDQVAPLFHEPYFENEALMELGFSFEHAVSNVIKIAD
jgi:hypothetical protein